MMLELHNVKIGELIPACSLTVDDGQLVCLAGQQGSGKTTLLRAILGFIPIDDGFISIDGELLTPQSAPYFRKQMAYVPQRLSLPEGYEMGIGYLQLLHKAVQSGRKLLIVDEPQETLTAEEENMVDQMLQEASQRGTTVLAVNPRILKNQVRL